MDRRFFSTLSIVIPTVLMQCTGYSLQNNATDAIGLNKSHNATDEFDIFVLAQQWPQTNCWSVNKNWSSLESQCSLCAFRNSEDKWTLHGLWPSKYRGQHPSNCNPNITYQPELLDKDLRTKMTDEWPTMKLKTANDAFWDHEWKKHGTCALKTESTNSIAKYFSKSLELLREFNVGKILAKAGFTPGGSYDLQSLRKTFNDTLNAGVFVKCAKDNATKDLYLEEIHICFDKSFKLTHCNGSHQKCNKDLPIKYPKPLGLCSRSKQPEESS